MTPAEARIQDAEISPEDEFDRSLRPRRLEDFVGQEADGLLQGATGERAQDLIAEALRAARG